jgi:3-oxoacyl-(acyl-carrier-protein) synthase
MRKKGFKPLGMEILAVGVSSNASDLITPSFEGPKIAIQRALADACVTADQVGTWDLHATGTPGDYLELSTLRSIFPDPLLVTTRKGTFGHGMSASAGWELTAQYLSCERGAAFPTALRRERLNSSIEGVHRQFVFDKELSIPGSLAGKLSMGVGGINACVISRRWDSEAQYRS